MARRAGNCWNCDKPGHTAKDCRHPRRAGVKSLEDDEDDDDESSSDEDSPGEAGLSLGCLDADPNFVDISWRVPLFNDLYNVSREAATHPSDEVGGSRNTFVGHMAEVDGSDELCDLLAFSTVDSDSGAEDEDENDDEPNPELLRAIEEEVESRRAIERAGKSKESDEKLKESEWKEVPVTRRERVW